jgi:protein-tyrosine phosphatase
MSASWMRLLVWKRHAKAAATPVDGPAMKILLVCTGNICRSPTAHAVLAAKLRAKGLHERISVDSAGTHGFHVQEPPDVRAQRHGARRGYDLKKLRARGVAEQDFQRFDLILAMDHKNLDWLREKAPAGSTAALGLLMSHARRHPEMQEVPDPYYGAGDGFERVLDLVEDACDGLVEDLLSGTAMPKGTS